MSSQLRSEAARANGTKSQGPATPAGRAHSSQNALRHGLCSLHVVIPGENPAEFEELRASYVELFQPRSRPELDLAESMAAARWRLRRIHRIETELLSRDQTGLDLASVFDDLAAGKTPALLIRYERHLNRIYEIARKELQILQKIQVAPASAGDLRKLPNEPKPQPIQALRPVLVPPNQPEPTLPAVPPAEKPDLLPETPHQRAQTA